MHRSHPDTDVPTPEQVAGRTGPTAWTLHRSPDPESAARPPVLLLHGVTDSGECWPGVVAHLAHTRDVLTLDARGHGASDLPDEPFTIAALADDAARAAGEALGRAVVVVGHSMGGLTAQELALRHPGLVVGLVLEDPAWGVADVVRDEGGRPLFLASGIDAARGRPTAELAADLRARHPRWSPAESEPWARAQAALSPRLLDVPHEWTGRDWPVAFDGGVPVVVVAGEEANGSLVPDDGARRATEALDGAGWVVRVAGAGHCVRRDDPTTFLGLVDGLLALLDGAGAALGRDEEMVAPGV
ncbi:alpha/beta fold hydrolase [Oerskovia turbata]